MTIHANVSFIPSSPGSAESFSEALPAESVDRLISNGTLNVDRTINETTAHRLGRDAHASWTDAPKDAREPNAQPSTALAN